MSHTNVNSTCYLLLLSLTITTHPLLLAPLLDSMAEHPTHNFTIMEAYWEPGTNYDVVEYEGMGHDYTNNC